MATTVKIDPITRIEGHLAFQVEVVANTVVDARCSGEMFRGFEVLLQGRHPMDAQQMTQRICGVCPISHGIASILAQDAAYQVKPPRNGVLLRNLVQGANFMMSHIVHFYHLCALDFIDITAITQYAGSDAALTALKGWVQTQLASKTIYPAAPFLPRYEGQYSADGDFNIQGVKHYLDALNIRAACHKMVALFGGKAPHAHTLVPGGMTEHVSVDKIAAYLSLLQDVTTFIEQSYLPDVLAVAQTFPEYWDIGKGYGNFLVYGVFRSAEDPSKRLFPAGVIVDGALSPLDERGITEDVMYSWFSSPSGTSPLQSQTTPDPEKANAYSWIKAPRYHGQAMEVGSLARLMVACAHGETSVKTMVDQALSQTGRTPANLVSVMGRHLTRALEAKLIAEQCRTWIDQLVPGQPTFQSFTIPDSAQGVGLTEASRGALGHWIELAQGKIKTYQCVVPSTWNCSPRDDKGNLGVIEKALLGAPVADAAQPMEVARIVRSFDPCIACAVH